MNAKTMLFLAKKHMRPEEIDVRSEWGGSDLYLKVTPFSTALVREYDFANQVTKFKSPIDNERWFDIPFANTDWWEKRKCFCGAIQDDIAASFEAKMGL